MKPVTVYSEPYLIFFHLLSLIASIYLDRTILIAVSPIGPVMVEFVLPPGKCVVIDPQRH